MADEAPLPSLIESEGFPITLVFAGKKAFFSERITGNLWAVENGQTTLIHSFPIVKITGHHETGLLGIVLDPDFEQNNFIYCFYSYGQTLDNLKNKIVRLDVKSNTEITILDNIPGGVIHNGGIMAFAPDKTLYIGVGIQNEIMDKSQDANFWGGKVLRINPDGTIPKDNPIPGSPVYSWGHRNIFGLAFHPTSGKLYVCDEGPDHDDEINIIEKGGNYGWPEVMGKSDDPKFISPIQTYTPCITPTQCVFVNGKLYFGSYNEGTVHSLTLSGENFDAVAEDKVVYRGKSFGTIGVFYSPDKHFYITTPNKILEFTPINENP
ncbi:hypothetical protein A2617_00120 [Candidatus Daviesbacteria bacterium RIFOXYD1_FULL_41_10]|uniref:Glucose/Sorbosone dehydrogenase domain-containing protein n=2 Tax=Candidatus Daviesiibacteriota TaxID=1752718 RepID=A0A1F5N176_9BACT|nr:MAG: Glucose sorbosone dehydrogenase [Candidatus Daviesbacteria bacterium GW2011_GWB1_41_5]OGE71333.1 MAG: hypothetical protein A2617_00120 [Candidatus Daviesbacteria bacterium RIFOXYD1_FULL_41_10]